MPMNARTFIKGIAFAALMTASVASAQTAPSNIITVSSNPATSVTPGTGVSLGSITFGAPTSGSASLVSVPLSLTTTGGGSPSNLSNCRVYNAAGQEVSNLGTVSLGTNTVTFTNPLALSSTGGAATLTIRCDVASSTPAGSTFRFTASAPMYAPSLGVALYTTPTVSVGDTNQLLAIVWLDASRSGQNINVSSIPLTVTGTGGATNAHLSSCAVRRVSDIGTALNTGGNAITGTFLTGPTFNLDTPLSVGVGNAIALAVTCNVSASAPVGGTYVLSVNPAQVVARNASNSAQITPGADINAAGLTARTSGTVTLIAQGTTPGGGTGGNGSTPGVPNTGAGDIFNLIVLAGAAVLASAGLMYVRRARNG